ncbi:MAG: hypothetical protein KDD35_07650 [Bdellovibrionales bacterium]|nr:hypothetical protein [Bdellovibrionales bacterium]
MVTNELKAVAKKTSRMSRSHTSNVSSSPVRIKQNTKARLNDLLSLLNKHSFGRKLKPDDVIHYALGLVNETHVEEICESVLTNKDRLERLFRATKKEHRNLTKDQFYGLLMDGKVTMN